MAFSGEQFAFDQRQRVVRELERLRREGVLAAKQVLDMITPQNIEVLWPYAALMLDRLLMMQQEAGRDAMSAWMGAVGVGTGLGVAEGSRIALPAGTRDRDGRLPSGMPWRRLTSTGLIATAHRIENGMSAPEAVNYLKSQMVAAVADQAHDESRRVATDYIQSSEAGVDWAELDAEYERRIAEIRRDAADMELRRTRRNRSSKQKARMGWYVGSEPLRPPGVTRYIRVPNPGACSFCLLLATRGAVYYRDSFRERKAFRKDGSPRVHANCRCTVFPEPSPGAWRKSVVGDEAQYAAAIWRNKKFNREYELTTFLHDKQMLSLGDVARSRYILTA